MSALRALSRTNFSRYQDDPEVPEGLQMIRSRKHLMSLPVEERTDLKGAGLTWEDRSSWSPMDAEAFKMIPLIEAGQSADWDTLFSQV